MEMKRLLIAMLAGMILMACSSDHFLGDPATGKTEVEEPVAIDFGSTARAVTRASHEESAKLLNNKFYIYGAKTSSTGTTNAPFDNYQVQYNASSAGTTDTNSSDWEYNGLTSKKGVPQGIRYWDFSAPKYEFVAAAGLADDEFITNTTDGMRIKVADADADELRQKIEAARQRIAAQVMENAEKAQQATEDVKEAAVEAAESVAEEA